MKKIVLLAIALMVAGSLAARADNLTVTVGNSATAGDIPIPGSLTYGINGPVSWDNEYTWSSTNYNSVFGYTGNYGFGSNGSWGSSMGPFIGLNSSTAVQGIADTMTIAFTNPVYAFADFFNFTPDANNPAVVNVYDVHGNLIGTYTLNFSTGGASNSGEWLSFSSSTALGYFTMTDDDIAMTSTPEPSTLSYFLLAAICGGVMLFVSRRAAV